MSVINLYYRQFLALIPANFLSTCGGFHLAYGIFNSNIGLKIWMQNFQIAAISMVPISYHIMAFLGGVFASFYYKNIEIYKLHLTSSFIMLTGAVAFFTSEHNFYAILSARILIGFGFGCSHISSLFYIAEISSPKIRAHSILFHHLCLTLGMLLHSISHPFNAIFGLGIFLIILITSSIPIGYYTMKESHVFLMQNNNKDSLDRMKYFQKDDDRSMDLEHDVMQSYLIDEDKRKMKFFGRHNILTFLVIAMVQIGYVAVFNGLHNHLRLIYMKSFLMEYTETAAISARIIGILISFPILNFVPKKFQFSIPGIFISIILAVFGALIIFYSQLWLPLPFFITIEFLLGLGINGIAEILKSELFPMKERAFSVAILYFFEEGFQVAALIVLYSWAFGLGSNPTYWPFIFSGILFIFAIMVIFNLKDSRKQNLVDSAMLYAN